MSSNDLIKRLRKCQEMIGNMCREGRPPKMSIPAQMEDEDIFIRDTIDDAIRELGGTE